MSNSNTESVPRLDLAPRLDHPLRPGNPVDYLRLLYWVFFFPQALGWYEETFFTSSPTDESPSSRWQIFQNILRVPSPQRTLFFMGQVITVIVPVGISLGLQQLGIEIEMVGVGIGVAVGVAYGGGIGVSISVEYGVAIGILFGVLVGVGGGVAGFAGGGVAFVTAFMMALGVMNSIRRGVTLGVAFVVTISIIVGVAVGIIVGVVVSIRVGVAVGMLPSLMSIGLPNYLCFLPFTFFGKYQSSPKFSRTSWLPQPNLQSRALQWLVQDPRAGVANCNAILSYSFQFIPVVQATNQWLAQATKPLTYVNYLVEDTFDWNLIRFNSASLPNALRNTGISFITLESWRQRWPNLFNGSLRLDTPARAACAGFYHLHRKNTEAAVEAFSHVRHLDNGKILFQSAAALHEASQPETLGQIAGLLPTLNWLTLPIEKPLRSAVIASLQQLYKVGLEANVANESISRLNRTAALGRAGAVLTEFIENVEQICPYPEWPIVKSIAESWRDILSLAAGEIGEMVIAEPVANPFIAGNPVHGQLFVGRSEIFRRLEELWGSIPNREVNSVVLYGHRRMGKTSILQNLGQHRFGTETIIAQFTMQRAGYLQSSGQLLHYLGLAIYDALHTAGIRTLLEPDSDHFQQDGYASFNQYLRQIKSAISGKRLILTLDEFELIEKAIQDGRVDAEILNFLRGVIHSEPWLVLALAGLHTLQEMTKDYWNPLFSSVTPIRVSFLDETATGNLLANPTPDFPLDFDRPTVRYIFEQVQGQPFLTQLIGQSLVSRYNQTVFEEGKPRERRFTIEDVAAVINDPVFYELGSYYFTGVWGQAEDSLPHGQTALLLALARNEDSLSETILFNEAGLTFEVGRAALKMLEQHDVVYFDGSSTINFTVPLMRRWIRLEKLRNVP